MTEQEKQEIVKLRSVGFGYGKISQILNISKSTISSFCKSLDTKSSYCLMCNSKLKQTKGHRQRKFCSDKCRLEYWKLHKKEINRKPNHTVECFYCHKKFITFKSLNRKFCSWDCFSKNRMEKTSNG